MDIKYLDNSFIDHLDKANMLYEICKKILPEWPDVVILWSFEQIVISCDSLKHSGKCRGVLRKLFPDIKFTFHKWCPYNDTVILGFTSDVYRIEVQVRTTVEDDPTRNTKCKFKREVKETFSLVCDTE